MKAICINNSHTFRNRLTIGKVYDIIERYIDSYNTDIVDIICDDEEKRPYRADRFNIID